MGAMNSRRAWLMFSIAIAAYMVAVLQRSSLGVAAVEATDRFSVNAAALSTLAVVQIVVYAALQIPVGVMLDRVGPEMFERMEAQFSHGGHGGAGHDALGSTASRSRPRTGLTEGLYEAANPASAKPSPESHGGAH